MNWFNLAAWSLAIGGLALLAIGEWRDRKWWRTSDHPSFFQH
jgi:hypothetical protein